MYPSDVVASGPWMAQTQDVPLRGSSHARPSGRCYVKVPRSGLPYAATGAIGLWHDYSMTSQDLAAIAAVAAALISLANIFLTAFLAQRHEGRKWVRELLPELIGQFANAAFEFERLVFQTDWSELNEKQRDDLGMEEYRKAKSLQDKIETFASPATISATRDLLYSVDGIRFASYAALESGNFEIWHPERRKAYWAYAEAHYKFMVVARKEMGLKPPPMPPGLARQKSSVKNAVKMKVAENAEDKAEAAEVEE